MKKKNIYLVLTHVHRLKKFSKTEWEVTEYLEIVDKLKSKHYATASAIGDYTAGKMIVGTKVGMTEYTKFDTYIRNKYPNEMSQVDTRYGDSRAYELVADQPADVFVDSFGNQREKTVFDV